VPEPRPKSRGSFFCRPALLLACVLLLTALVYAGGLNGPFLFDDPPNLILPLNAWLSGETGWQEVFLGNHSGLLGRPLSMLTFVANAAMSGMQPLPFKATDLAIHLICGLLIYKLIARLLRRDRKLASNATPIALFVSSIWLLHPIQVSTVLYIVQRMAQLSALFMLLALIFYVHAREALEQGRVRAGVATLFLAVPTATVFAMLCKENGALVPLLCGVIEIGYFNTRDAIRPRVVTVFFSVFLFIPGALAAGLCTFRPSFVLAGYDERLFTFGERLLSEPRALFDYISALLLPRGPMLGIYTDDFVVSHGILSPPATLFALVGLAFLLLIAWVARKQAPAVSTGIGLYLAGHAMESTIFPLELYFEHRNYLPSVGFFLALAGAIGWIIARKRWDEPVRIRRLCLFAATTLVATLAIATFARASVWRYWPLLAQQGALEHPNSMRAQLDHASMLIAARKYTEARQVFEHLAQIDNPAARHVALIDSVFLQCIEYGEADPESVARIPSIGGTKLELAEMLAFEKFASYLHKHDCLNLTRASLAAIIRDVADAAPQPSTLIQIWRSRFVAAELFMHDGFRTEAQQQAALSWMGGTADPAVGAFLARVYYINGDLTSAHVILEDVREHIKSWDTRNLKEVDQIQNLLDDMSVPSKPPEGNSAIQQPMK